MDEVPAYVLDASVGIKWVLQLEDEPHLDHALGIAEDLEYDRIHVIVPPAFGLEMGYAIQRAMRRERITPAQADEAYRRYLRWGLQTDDNSLAIRAMTWEISRRYGCSFYDASYLATSDQHQLPLIHADGKLHTVLAGRFARELWIEEYRPVRS